MISENRVPTKQCVVCNTERPIDYFIGDERICWTCKNKGLTEPERKHGSNQETSQDGVRPHMSDSAMELVRLASYAIEKRYCSRGCRYYQRERAYKCSKFKPAEDHGSISCYAYNG